MSQPGGESALFHFHGPVDRTLTRVAHRYGTSADDIYQYNRRHHDRHGEFRSMHAFLTLIDQGMAFWIPTPRAEREQLWELVSPGQQVTLREYADILNHQTRRLGQPRVSAELLWSYLVNTDMRYRCLSSTSEENARRWDGDPNQARLPADVTVYTPWIEIPIGPPVAAAPGQPAVVAARPSWLSSYEAHIVSINNVTRALDSRNDDIQRFEEACAKDAGRIHFIHEYMKLIPENARESGRNVSGWYPRVERALNQLHEEVKAHMLVNPTRHYRREWVTDRTELAQRLVGRLTDGEFSGWHNQLLRHHREFRDGAAAMAASDRAHRLALIELWRSKTEAAAGYIDSLGLHFTSGSGDDPLTEPQYSDVPLRTTLSFYSSLLSAGVGNAPGPMSLVVAATQYRTIRAITQATSNNEIRRAVDQALTSLIRGKRPRASEIANIRRMLMQSPPADVHTNPATARAWRLQLRQNASDAASRLNHDVTGGPGWSGLLFVCNAIAIFNAVADGAENGQMAWSAFLGTASASLNAVVTAADMVARLASSLRSDATIAARFSEALEPLGNAAALLAVVAAVVQFAEYFGTDPAERSSVQLASAIMQVAGTAMTLYGAMLEGGGASLQFWGIVIAIAASVVANWEAVVTGNGKRLVMGQLKMFRSGGTEVDEHDNPLPPVYVDRGHPAVPYLLVAADGSDPQQSLKDACDELYQALNNDWNNMRVFLKRSVQSPIVGRIREHLKLEDAVINQIVELIRADSLVPPD